MKKTYLTICGIFLGLIFCFAYFSYSLTSSAQKNARLQWEYCAITSAYAFSPENDKLNRIYGLAEICYLQPNGCRRSEVKEEIDYGKFLQDRALSENFASRKQASLKASEVAFQKAMSQLGYDGWEIVSEPNLKYEFVNIDEYNKYEDKSYLFTRESANAVYFKRLKF